MPFSFPRELTEHVMRVWQSSPSDLVRPSSTLPPRDKLEDIISAAFLTSMETEEGRALTFKICVSHRDTGLLQHTGSTPFQIWQFAVPRRFSVSELRRLAPASSHERSMICVTFSEDSDNELLVEGVLNIGESWERVRGATGYAAANVPNLLNIEAAGPGHLLVYEGQFLKAELQRGEILTHRSAREPFPLGLDATFRAGLNELEKDILWPRIEPMRFASEFALIAHRNVFVGISNLLQKRGNGGTIIIAPPPAASLLEPQKLDMKFQFSPPKEDLRDCFCDFLDARNAYSDLLEQRYDADEPGMLGGPAHEYQLHMAELLEELHETMAFVADLGQVDGAVAMTSDFRVLGFGAEIRLPEKVDIPTLLVKRPIDYLRNRKSLPHFSIDSVGMRHRSAIRLCAAIEGLVCIVVSHDGSLSAIWNEGKTVFVHRSFRLVNQSTPWA